MTTNLKSIDAKMIESWCRAIRCNPRRGVDSQTNWRFDMAYPPNSPHQITVANTKEAPGAVMIVSGVNLAPEHLVTFQGLDQDAKLEFLLELQQTLLRDHVEFMLVGLNPQTVSCPTGFQLHAMVFEDGLTMDVFATRVSSVYKAELAGMLCVQRHLGPSGASNEGGEFGFRRLGIQ